MTLTVNGETVDQKEIDSEAERLRADYDRYVRENNSDGGEEQLRQWSKENVVERLLIRQEAGKLDEEIPKEDIEKIYKENKESFSDMGKKKALAEIELQVKSEKLVEKVAEETPLPTDEEAKEAYDAEKDRFTMPEQVRVSHIVKHLDGGQDRTQAFLAISNIEQQLKQGVPFETLASENSDCPDNAGDLGCFGRGEMVQEFEDVVFSMKEGDVSEVFLTPFGYHIAKLQEKHPQRVMPFEEVKERIKEELVEEKKQQAVEAFIDRLKEQAEVVES